MEQLVRDWLLPLTTALRDAAWSMPLGQGIHLLGVSLLLGSAVLLYPRVASTQPADTPEALVARYRPWMLIAFVLLGSSGFVLFAAEPARMMRSPVFQAKMALLVLALATTAAVWRSAAPRDGAAGAGAPRWLALSSLCLWLAIAASGRLIGYGRRLLDHFFG